MNMAAMQISAVVSSVNQRAGSLSSPVDTEADFVAEGSEVFAAGVADAFFTALLETPVLPDAPRVGTADTCFAVPVGVPDALRVGVADVGFTVPVGAAVTDGLITGPVLTETVCVVKTSFSNCAFHVVFPILSSEVTVVLTVSSSTCFLSR